jgi:hypothetical protein
VDIMLSGSPARYRLRPASRVIPGRHTNTRALGCVVVRRITDDAGRAWRVREFRSATGLGLFFRCDIPGIRSETRAVAEPLESLDDERLINLLQTGVE